MWKRRKYEVHARIQVACDQRHVIERVAERGCWLRGGVAEHEIGHCSAVSTLCETWAMGESCGQGFKCEGKGDVKWFRKWIYWCGDTVRTLGGNQQSV